MNHTVMVVAGVLVIWLVLFIPFMIMNQKRKEKEKAFVENISGHSLINIYSNDILIDGREILTLKSVIGENGQKIVLLPAGKHQFEGYFETTDTFLGKTRNLKTEKLKFEIELKADCKYVLALYVANSENTNNEKDIFVLPLTLYGGNDSIKANIVCYLTD